MSLQPVTFRVSLSCVPSPYTFCLCFSSCCCVFKQPQLSPNSVPSPLHSWLLLFLQRPALLHYPLLGLLQSGGVLWADSLFLPLRWRQPRASWYHFSRSCVRRANPHPLLFHGLNPAQLPGLVVSAAAATDGTLIPSFLYLDILVSHSHRKRQEKQKQNWWLVSSEFACHSPLCVAMFASRVQCPLFGGRQKRQETIYPSSILCDWR